MSKPFSHAIPDHIEVEDLRNNADIRQKELVRRTFEADELIEMKEEFFALSSRVNARLELAAALKEAATIYDNPIEAVEEVIADRVDPIDYGEEDVKILKTKTSALLKKINAGYDDLNEQVYGMAFHEAGFMAFYDEHGMFVYDRRLKPTERQTSIRNMKSA